MTQLSRRDLARATAAATAGLWFGFDPALAARRSRIPLARGGTFGWGVASGSPSPTGITLWTRVGELPRSAKVRLEVALDPDFRHVVRRGTAVANSGRDFTVHRRVGRLRPGERYWYRFATRDQNGPVGTFRTLNPVDSREPLKIGFFSCQQYTNGYYAAHAALARERDLDYVIALGDYIYETGGRGAVPGRDDRTGRDRDGRVYTLDDYRAKYRLYQSDPDLQATQAVAPIIAIWDDHEVENDWAVNGGTDTRRRIPYLERRANGYRAFYESLPMDRIQGAGDRLYRSLPLGVADLILIDTRQYRDDQVGAQALPSPASEDPRRTLLGAEQKAWFKDELARSRAPWRVVANQVMIMGLDFPYGNALNPDQWDGYKPDREEIGRFCIDRGIRDITFITGDIHTFFAGTVTTGGRIDTAPWATEFVGGSITSSGLTSALDLPDGTAPALEAAQLANPHIPFLDFEYKGYGVMTVSEQRIDAEFKAVRTIRGRDGQPFSLKKFRVARGSTTVEPL